MLSPDLAARVSPCLPGSSTPLQAVLAVIVLPAVKELFSSWEACQASLLLFCVAFPSLMVH
jgi:hypothetical protein